jgi:hypothetical protein
MHKKQIMTANRYRASLVEMRRQVEEAIATRDYQEWVKRTNEAISEINRRIRATNKETNEVRMP